MNLGIAAIQDYAVDRKLLEVDAHLTAPGCQTRTRCHLCSRRLALLASLARLRRRQGVSNEESS